MGYQSAFLFLYPVLDALICLSSVRAHVYIVRKEKQVFLWPTARFNITSKMELQTEKPNAIAM